MACQILSCKMGGIDRTHLGNDLQIFLQNKGAPIVNFSTGGHPTVLCCSDHTQLVGISASCSQDPRVAENNLARDSYGEAVP